MKWMLAIAVFSMAFAGCTKDDAPSPAETCDGWLDSEGECQPHVEPSLTMTGLPDTVAQFEAVNFTWNLDNGTYTKSDGTPLHSMANFVRGSMEDTVPTNTTLPADWGMEIAKAEHQDLPASHEGEFQWDEQGTVYLYGYMEIGGDHHWYNLGTVLVDVPMLTGETEVITISAPPGGVDRASVTMTVGDELQFVNENQLYGYTISFQCDDGTMADINLNAATSAAVSSTPVAMLVETSCEWTGTATGELEQLEVSGTININKP